MFENFFFWKHLPKYENCQALINNPQHENIVCMFTRLVLSSVITQNQFLQAVHDCNHNLDKFPSIYVKVGENLCKRL